MNTYQFTCFSCGETFELEIRERDYLDFRSGVRHAQHAFPYLTPDERELIISRTCGTCFDEMFSGDEVPF